MSEAVKAERYPEFLRLLADFQSQGGRVGPELSYYEAVAREKAGQAVPASEAVGRFIAQAGREHPLYAQALLLYGRVEPAVRRIQEARQGLEPLLQALERGHARVRLQLPALSGPPEAGLAGVYDAGLSVRGTRAAGDGGWMSFGAGSGAGAEQPPLPAWWRYGLDGRLIASQAFDVEHSPMGQLMPGSPTSRNTLGIGVQPVTGPGVVVALGPGSDAAAAGLRVGDRITHVDGRALRAEDSLFQKRDPFFDVLRAVQGDVRLGVQRPGSAEPIEIRVPAIPDSAPEVPGLRFGSSLLTHARWLTGAAKAATPTGEAVAWIDDGTAGARVCANLRFQNGGHGTGFWGYLAPDGSPLPQNLWILPLDHPAAMDGRRSYVPWRDSTIHDCVRLPDGAMLVASAATRRGNNGVAVSGDSANRAFRVLDAEGHTRASVLVRASSALERANAMGQRLRFAPLADGDGWRWAWGDWEIDTRSRGLEVRPTSAAATPLQLLAATGDAPWHQLVVAGRAVPVVGRASARDLQLHETAELADGSLLALLTMRVTPALHPVVLPDGAPLGAELLRPDAPIAMVVAVDPSSAAMTWAAFPRHGQAVAARELARAVEARARTAGTVAKSAGAVLAELGERGLLWNTMTRLGDGSVLLQTGLDQRVFVRPMAGAGQASEPAADSARAP
ncbi:PDZ domain-containing protein [Comamonadaceae bacterium G21597-S1]|nr:PDZ domain-containing protein [Comamonadaceae bacterium G21597-S1]